MRSDTEVASPREATFAEQLGETRSNVASFLTRLTELADRLCGTEQKANSPANALGTPTIVMGVFDAVSRDARFISQNLSEAHAQINRIEAMLP